VRSPQTAKRLEVTFAVQTFGDPRHTGLDRGPIHMWRGEKVKNFAHCFSLFMYFCPCDERFDNGATGVFYLCCCCNVRTLLSFTAASPNYFDHLFFIKYQSDETTWRVQYTLQGWRVSDARTYQKRRRLLRIARWRRRAIRNTRWAGSLPRKRRIAASERHRRHQHRTQVPATLRRSQRWTVRSWVSQL